VGPRAVLDVVVKRKIPSPSQESNPRTLIIQSHHSVIIIMVMSGAKFSTFIHLLAQYE
jgi:hypothetical protein